MFGFVFVYKKSDFCKALAQADDPEADHAVARQVFPCFYLSIFPSIFAGRVPLSRNRDSLCTLAEQQT